MTAIIFIGFLTAIIGDVAAMFGCTIGLKDSVTAITLVALGTSLPGINFYKFSFVFFLKQYLLVGSMCLTVFLKKKCLVSIFLCVL